MPIRGELVSQPISVDALKKSRGLTEFESFLQMRYNFALAFILICMISATAQTSSDFERKYGAPVGSHVVSEHILMTPEYSTDVRFL